MTKTVVVLGGSLGGMAVTHRLLKYTRPHEEDLKVILVSKVKKPGLFPQAIPRGSLW
jgi:NADH dehydrogenase FAD-containing subunit